MLTFTVSPPFEPTPSIPLLDRALFELKLSAEVLVEVPKGYADR
jgi:hypothetical protein